VAGAVGVAVALGVGGGGVGTMYDQAARTRKQRKMAKKTRFSI
jgi:hypothetical protein